MSPDMTRNLTICGGFIAVYIITFTFFVIKRKFRSPEKSWKNSLINVALTPLRIFKVGPYAHGKISLEGSMKSAIKKTKLNDFGGKGADFVEMYGKIMNSVSFKNQKFHNLGYISANIEISMALARRLTLVEYLKENPKVLDIPVRAPVFVMGLPRTGTTFLHRLLSLDPAVRAPITWELLNPVPKVNGNTDMVAHGKDRVKRRNYIDGILSQRKSMGDEAIAHIHEVETDLPEECLLCLTDHLPCLPMLLYDCYMNIDAFLTVDSTDAYTTYKKYLQLLSSQTNDDTTPKGWMLKCPAHLFYPKQIASVFPDAKLIWNHRHPVSAVPSLCSLLKAFHQLYYEPECRDECELGKKIKYVSEKLLMQAPKDIEESGLESANVVYNELIKDPSNTVKKIYKTFNWDYTVEYDTILQAYLAKNRAEREVMKKKNASKGAALHTYTPEEFGLTTAELQQGDFAKYAEKYNIPLSKG